LIWKLFRQIIEKIAKTNTIKKILKEIRNLFLTKAHKTTITTNSETAMEENLILVSLIIIFMQIYFVCILNFQKYI
jgi:hypothetical protein